MACTASPHPLGARRPGATRIQRCVVGKHAWAREASGGSKTTRLRHRAAEFSASASWTELASAASSRRRVVAACDAVLLQEAPEATALFASTFGCKSYVPATFRQCAGHEAALEVGDHL